MKTIEEFLSDLTVGGQIPSSSDIDKAFEGLNLPELLAPYLPSADTSKDEEAEVVNNPLPKEFHQCYQILHKIISNDEKHTVELNAKLRRKVKRAFEILSPLIPLPPSPPPVIKPTTLTHNNNNNSSFNKQNGGGGEEEEAEAEKKAAIPSEELIADKNLVTLIEMVRSSNNAEILETNLNAIRPGIGNTHSRRKLKRTIEQILTKSEIEEGINARIRRRITRVMKVLAPGEGGGGDGQQQQQQQQPSSSSSGKEGGGEKEKSKAKDPLIIFVGQLPFDCTENDLLAFFRSHDIHDPGMKIRLLTNPSTQEFRGMAFVEFSSGYEMNRALQLHHSLFKSRKINIERSCGGKNKDKKKEILQQNRTKQLQDLEITFQQIFSKYEKEKILEEKELGREFQEKLMRYSPIYLSQV